MKFLLGGSIFLLSASTGVDAFTAPAKARALKVSLLSSSSLHAAGPFKPWPEEVVDCMGDYRDQDYIEQHIGGPLYSKQNDMPELPVHPLEDTMKRLLPTVLPYAETPDDTKSLQDAMDKFPEEAKHLKERLEERAKEYKGSSWLQQIWQTAGYLGVRDPVAIFVSYFLLVPNDDKLKDVPDMNIARAAALLINMAEGRKAICSGSMPYENIAYKEGEVPLCSTSFKYMFHGCRIPAENQDYYKIYDPSKHHHVIIASKGQFYSMNFVDEETGDPLPLATLEARLKKCVALSEEQKDLPQLGWLTSCNRDVWAKARTELIETGGDAMKAALAKMESGAFMINLDDEEPDSLSAEGRNFWYGGDNGGGANRWMDKSIQLVCTKNAKVAYLAEHSMADAAPAIPLITRMIKGTYSRLAKKQPEDVPDMSDSDGIENIFADCWKSEKTLETGKKLAAEGKAKHEALTGDYDLKIVNFDGIGKKFLKKYEMGQEVVPMAMQLAAYRMLGKQVGTYEAALLRAFKHSRTETARPVSVESNAFVKAMDSDNVSREDKIGLLKKAAAALADYENNASKGLGVDRQLLGLACMMKDDDDIKPALFDHPAYQAAKTWRLSTSSVIFCPGFGPVVDDGMGIGFRVDGDSSLFIITSKKETDYVDQYISFLEGALSEIAELLAGEPLLLEKTL